MSDARRAFGRYRRLAVVMAGVAVLAAACGDDSSSGEADTSVPVVETTVPADTTAAPTTVAATTTTVAAATTTIATATTAATATTTGTATTKTTTATTKAASTTTATTVATATTVGKPTKSEILLGAPVGVSGPSALSQMHTVDVINAWTQWVNAELGGINGHPVKFIVTDTKSDAATASAVAKDMIDKNIIAEVGGIDTAADAIWAKSFSDAKIPVIGGNGYVSTTWNTFPGVFQINTGQNSLTPAGILAAKASGASKVGALVCSESAACAAAEPLYKPSADAIGIGYGGLVKVGAADPSYTAACISFRDAGVDWVQLSVTTAVAVRFIDDCAKQNYKPQYGAGGGTLDAATLEPLSKAGTNFGGWMQGIPFFAPAAKTLRDVMAKYAPGVEYRNPNQSVTWTSLEMFRKAMANASDNPTAAEVMTAMYNVKNETLGGLLPTSYSWTAGQPSKANTCFWVVKLVNGAWQGGNTACYP